MDLFKTALILPALVLSTGCLPKIDKDLPPLMEYQASEGWYEDAFIRVYKRDLDAGVHPEEDNFTHPWIVVKAANSEKVFSLELTPLTDKDETCSEFDHVDPYNTFQACGYINSIYGNELDSLEELEIAYMQGEYRTAYRLGELRGGDDVNQVAEFILFQTENYSCRNEYNYISYNSNTFARAMLEYSGFYQLYEDIHEEPFTLGNSSWGQTLWNKCPIETPE